MFAKCERRVLVSRCKITVELKLQAQRLAIPCAIRLALLGVADRLGESQNIGDLGFRHEEHTVFIPEHHVVVSDRPITDLSRLQGVRIPGFKTLRAGWRRPHGEDRQRDGSYLGRIAMQSPDHDSRHPRGVSFERDEIADARFVQAATVVDHQDIAGCGEVDRLEEHIDAAVVPHGKHAAGDVAPRDKRLQRRRSAAHLDTGTDTRIRHMGGGQRGETRAKLIVERGEGFLRHQTIGVSQLA